MRVEVPTSGPAPRGNSGAVPPKSLLVPPKRELCPPSEDCAPKKVTDSVPLKGSLRPETPKMLIITPELVSKNCFFADFAIKTCSAFVFFFWSSPPNSIVEFHAKFATRTLCFLVYSLEFEEIKFLSPPKNCVYLSSHATLAPALPSLPYKTQLRKFFTCFGLDQYMYSWKRWVI